MELFHVIDDGVAIIRSGQIWKQVKLYQRAGVLFVPHGGGYVRVTARFGDTWGTSVPSVKVVEMDGSGVVAADEPSFVG